MARLAASPLPPVATLWVGDSLDWVARLALASFAHRGHDVILYRVGRFKDPGIPGVTLREASEIYSDPELLLDTIRPAAFADIFRLHMIRDTGAIWFDTDALCHRPLKLQDGYLIGHEASGWVNNAVMYLPPDSAALAAMIAALSDPSRTPEWLHPSTQKKIRTAPEGQRLLTALDYFPNALGPRALTYFLQQSGEIDRALPDEVLNPVPWTMTDVLFNPHGGYEGWVTESTLTMHLYLSRVRKYHRKTRPHPDSYIGKLAVEVGCDLSELRAPSE